MKFTKHIHYDYELEKAVIGQIVLERHAIGRVIGSLKAEHFYSEAHKDVYAALEEMFKETVPIDSLTLCNYLVNKKKIHDFNGENVHMFVLRLTNSVCSSAHLEFHAHILTEQWQRRRILELKYAALEDDGVNPLSDIKNLQNQLQDILGGEVKKEWVSMDELIVDLFNHQIKMANGDFKYITTTFNRIDRDNGGFTPGDLIIIGARPRVGKSSLLGKLAIGQARKGFKVGILSLEMANIAITARMAALETGIPYMKIYRDIAKDEAEHRRFYDIVSRNTVNLPIYVSDKTKVSIPEIRAKAIKLKREHGLDVLYIDYLQLIDGSTGNKNYNREQEVGQLSRGLKTLARELEIPVVALAQLNRDIEKRTGEHRYPKLSDLRESGSLEQDADVVMFLHRDWASGFETHSDTGESTENEGDLIIGKWRNGVEFRLPIGFDGPKMKFYELDESHGVALPSEGNWKPLNEQEVDYQGDNPF
jgi:replicative DNA helicase